MDLAYREPSFQLADPVLPDAPLHGALLAQGHAESRCSVTWHATRLAISDMARSLREGETFVVGAG